MAFIFSDTLAGVSGFAYGFIDSFCSQKHNFNSPMSCIFLASINGIIYGISTNFLSSLIPKPAKPVLPILITISTLKKHPELIHEIINTTKECVSNIRCTVSEDLQSDGQEHISTGITNIKSASENIINDTDNMFPVQE